MFEEKPKEKAHQIIIRCIEWGFNSRVTLDQIVEILINEIIIPTQDEPDVIYWNEVRDEAIKIIQNGKIL